MKIAVRVFLILLILSLGFLCGAFIWAATWNLYRRGITMPSNSDDYLFLCIGVLCTSIFLASFFAVLFHVKSIKTLKLKSKVVDYSKEIYVSLLRKHLVSTLLKTVHVIYFLLVALFSALILFLNLEKGFNLIAFSIGVSVMVLAIWSCVEHFNVLKKQKNIELELQEYRLETFGEIG